MSKFKRVLWVPDNHELWNETGDWLNLRAQPRYEGWWLSAVVRE
jgi:hypothetical protein